MIHIDLNTIKKHIQAGALLVDVRTPKEYALKHIEGAINIEYDHILSGIKSYALDKRREIILYCSNGTRSRIALSLLQNFGYTNVVNLDEDNL